MGLWILAILDAAALLAKLPARAYVEDFSVFYTSAIALRRGLDPYTVNLTPISQRLGMDIGGLIHTTDTPTAQLLFVPFSLATPPVAHTIWLALNFAALVAALILLIRPKYSGLDVRTALAITPLAIIYGPVTENFVFAQRQALILLLLVLMMRALKKGREAAAGLLLGLAVSYRAFPLLIAGYFILRRQWRPLIFTGIGFGLAIAVTVAGLGIPLCVSYIHGMRYAVTAFWYDPADVALREFIIRLFSYGARPQPDIRMRMLEYIIIVSAQIFIIALAAWPTYQSRQRPGFDRGGYGLWVVAAILLSPLSWIHYMVLLLIPFVEIANSARNQECSRRALWAAVASYLVVGIAHSLRENLISPVWWARGIKYLAEGSSVALLLGFLAAYWFATDAIGLATDAERFESAAEPSHAGG